MILKSKLSLMMFLEYFIWGAWYVTLGSYLFNHFEVTAVHVGSIYANLSIGAILSPFLIGLIADRFLPAQYVLAILHFLGAILLLWASQTTDFGTLWWVILFYTILYMPSISITNSISFSHLLNPEKEFPFVRVFGTIGWICVGLLLSVFNWETSPYTFLLAAVASVLLACLALILPHTPCQSTGKFKIKHILQLESLVLLKDKTFLTFFLCSIAICIPLSFYYSFTNSFLNDVGMQHVASKMTLGQLSEMLCMLVIPFMFKRLGVKYMLLIGVLAWVVRYVCFAYGNIEHTSYLLVLGIILHGVCYDFFFVTGQIYTDQQAPLAIRSAAQGLVTIATYGLGMLIGSYLAGWVTELYSHEASEIYMYHWESVWLFPAILSFVVMVTLLMFFKNKKEILVKAI